MEDPISLSATLDRIENESEVYKYILYIYIGASEEKGKFIDSEKVKITASERYETKFAGKKFSFIFGN